MYLLDTIGELPFARYEREQDKQDQNRHFQLLWSMLCLLLLCLTREVPKLTHRKKETSLHDKYFHNMIYFSFIYSSILLQKFINIHSKDMVTSQQQWKAETNHVYFKILSLIELVLRFITNAQKLDGQYWMHWSEDGEALSSLVSKWV